MELRFEKFEGALIRWPDLFAQAARFATGLGPQRVRCLSHSASGPRGIVTVWYSESAALVEPAPGLPLQLCFAFERGTLISWDELFGKVAQRAGDLHPDQVVNVSHSDAQGDGIAVLWYWGVPPDPDDGG